MKAITRSTGISFEGWAGPQPGGGYSGVTEELDATVMHAAKCLKDNYGCDVQVRYNSDRRSGGAFLMPESRWGVAGIGAGLRKVYPDRLSMGERSTEEVVDLLDRYPWNSPAWSALPDELYIDTVIHEAGARVARNSYYAEHATVEDALAYFIRAVQP